MGQARREKFAESDELICKGHEKECFGWWMIGSNLGKGRSTGGDDESVLGDVVDDGDDDVRAWLG